MARIFVAGLLSLLVSNTSAQEILYGSGLVVSRQGHILTNQHVLQDCAFIEATVEGIKRRVVLIADDTKNDLALLKWPVSVKAWGTFRGGPSVRPGEEIIVMGYPLRGLLATEASVSTGVVNALAGIGNNTGLMQISAPVQLGNSGGPVLDRSGRVIGVVVSKLNAMRAARATGDIPQNVNFAIHGAIAKTFLDAYGVQYETGRPLLRQDVADTVAEARRYTASIACFRRDQATIEIERLSDLRFSEPPSLEDFLARARPLAPNVSEQGLKQYWNEAYGHVDPSTLPSWDFWLLTARPHNPNVPDAALRAYWEDEYKVFGAQEQNKRFQSWLQQAKQDHPAVSEASLAELWWETDGPGKTQERAESGQAQERDAKRTTFDHEQAMAELTRTHPDWRQVVSGPGYQSWLSSQPADYQKLINESWDPNVVGASIDQYRASAKSK